MNLSRTIAAAALLAAAPAFAGNVTLNFEGVQSFAAIAGYYNGQALPPSVLPGPGGAPGPAWGITFGGDVLGLFNDALGPYFSNAPSPLGVMTVVGTDSTMNITSGFTGLSLFYSSFSAVTDAVQVWSGLNGTGSVLASFSLLGNAQTGGCTDSPLCNFNSINRSWAGVARSATFANATNVAVFDNLTVALVPEPASLAMLGLGLGLLAVTTHRRNR